MTVSTDATSTPALLDTVTEIDAAWIGSVLVSDSVRVAIDYAHRPDGAPDAVVAKFRPSDPATHAHGLGSGAYHREIGAYRAIAERAACRIPDAYHVAGDETNINLVLEDLTSATPGNQVAGCSPEEATAVMTELARLHATFTPVDEATAPAWPIRMADVCEYWTAATQGGVAAALVRYRDRLTTEDLEVVAAAAELVRPWYLLPQTRLTLSHGDPRVDNVLFERVAGAVRAVLIDWQVTGLRNPMYDVGYFLSGSLSVEDRRAHELPLIDHYLNTFAQTQPGYGPDEALADYRTQLLSGLMITTAAIAVLPDIEVVNTLILALLERNCAAARDWDAIEAVRRLLTLLP